MAAQVLLERLKALAASQPRLQAGLETIAQAVLPWAQKHLQVWDEQLRTLTRLQVLVGAVTVTAGALWLLSMLLTMWRQIQDDGGLLKAAFAVGRGLPGVRGYIAKEERTLRAKLLAGQARPSAPMSQLQQTGLQSSKVLSLMQERAENDILPAQGASRLSGALYMGDPKHRQLLDQTFMLFAHTNPLHPSVWPSVRLMEAEVISMTAGLLGGGPANPDVCGALTSGGTESILLAMKASRDWAKEKRGVRKPELLISQSAHPAYIKAAQYFNLKLVVVPVGANMRLSARAVARAITRNTVCVVASAPSFPHGVIDDVGGIAKVCLRWGVSLHVDCCLGGFVLPFLKELDFKVPPFDFSVKGVTSMSVDTHKYGQAHKGSSVVLYSSPARREKQFTSCVDWTGGLYISPSMAGSRNGALIACAWASLVHNGVDGYKKAAKSLLDLAARFIVGLKDIPELEIIGTPDMCLVAFQCRLGFRKSINIWQLNDWLSEKGWHLNALQNPAALHICFTPAHIDGPHCTAAQLLADLREGLAYMKSRVGAAPSGGSAPMYGMAAGIPDRALVGQFLSAFQDVQLAL